jgi:eukaryotic-like serine/threonine-protein kinase
MKPADDRDEVLFREARQRPKGPEREAYLDQACAGNEALRSRLGALLQAQESPDPFLEPPAGDLAAKTIPLPAPDFTVEEAGVWIGRYKLLEKIGEGGCGVVYLAEQEEPVKRRVALKVIRPGMDSKQVLARFEAERQALALMDHPNIAKVLDAGATGQGRPFFVMELVHGISITNYCDRNNLSTEQRLDLFLQACHAIQHAHQKGIIHRDIKPSNILVTVQDGQPVVKVIDFGIAKATAGQVLTDKTVYTAFEQFMGTPTYMSPEQAEMSPLDIDTRSDIYSLGVLLYELLTGKTPFDPQRLVEAGLEEIRRIIREEEPPRPSTRLSTMAAEEQTTTAKRRHTEAPQLVHLVRGDLDWIVMKALDKDRTRRYETANALASDIERHLNDEPVEAHAPSRLYRLRKLVRRHKLGFAAAGFIFAALAIGLGVSLWSLRKANREASRSAQVAQFLREMLQGVGPSMALGRDTAMLREILDKTAQRLDKELKGQPDVEADLRTTIGKVYFDLGQYTNAEAMHRQALALRKKLLGSEHPDVATSLNNLGNVVRQQGKFAEAETLYRQALAMRQKLLGSEHADVAGVLNNLATVLWERGKFAEAESRYREALAMQKKLLGSEDPDVATSLNNLAALLREEGKLEEAETLDRESLVMLRKLFGTEHPYVAASLCNLAMLLEDQGKLTEAETLSREALAMRKKLLGSEHPDVASSMMVLANVLGDEAKWGEAEALHREALAIRKKLLGSEHPDVARSLNDLAQVLSAEGKQTEAEALFREALAMKKRLLGSDHADVANSLEGLAAVRYEQGDLAEAEKLFRDALAIRRKLPGAEHLDEAQTVNNLAIVLRDLGKLSDAEALHREALAMGKRLLGSQDPGVASTLADLARTLLLEEKFVEAESLAGECLAIYEKRLPEDWQTFDAQSLLGGTLLRQKKCAEAEPLLLSGYNGMKEREDRIPAPAKKRRLREALQHLVQLYDATGKPAEAAKWKQE